MTTSGQAARNTRAERVERQLALPVVLAAMVSVPAVFLAMGDGVTATVGTVLNWASMCVLVGESLVLMLLSGDIFDWIRSHKWTVGITVLTVPAVIFMIGPVQILRMILAIGALRILRVGRILRAGRVLHEKAQLTTWPRRIVFTAVTVLAAAFVAIVLTDPTSGSRQIAEWILDRFGVVATTVLTVLAAAILAVGTLIVLRYRGSDLPGPLGGNSDQDESGEEQ
ncbi:hypothetical protein SAMN06265360_101272 [Haloechinothrix alba]|uniref:Voltage-gated potassium channel n=1 Tax=Haloechinothrix alba TaxID=664784 RepID=A0A238V3L7_9PSEU|nr:hypothetical protein [Haloechinothrix alba]SNR28856.1 hypothetical protein SAMN06265360_101272 [Haloechinothrix alba]